MLMLLLLFFSALLFLASLSSFFPWYVPSRSACPALRVAGLAALSCSLAGFEAMVCVAWVGADATGRCDVLLRVLLARTSAQSRPFPLHTVEDCRPLYLPVIDLAPRVGRAGWMHLQRRQTHLPAPPARTAPLRSSPSSALPDDSSHGSRQRKTPFQSF